MDFDASTFPESTLGDEKISNYKITILNMKCHCIEINVLILKQNA